MDAVVFIVAAAIVLAGALGVILSNNPVHSALSLVATLFGIAVLFLLQDAEFLAAVQVIVYAGAIVVLFLFVIMLLGVDRAENLRVEPLRVQRPLAVLAGVVGFGLLAVAIIVPDQLVTGERATGAALDANEPNVNQLARSLFSDFVLAFEVTSVLLIVAVIATVMLTRRPPRRSEHDVEVQQ